MKNNTTANTNSPKVMYFGLFFRSIDLTRARNLNNSFLNEFKDCVINKHLTLHFVGADDSNHIEKLFNEYYAYMGAYYSVNVDEIGAWFDPSKGGDKPMNISLKVSPSVPSYDDVVFNHVFKHNVPHITLYTAPFSKPVLGCNPWNDDINRGLEWNLAKRFTITERIIDKKYAHFSVEGRFGWFDENNIFHVDNPYKDKIKPIELYEPFEINVNCEDTRIETYEPDDNILYVKDKKAFLSALRETTKGDGWFELETLNHVSNITYSDMIIFSDLIEDLDLDPWYDEDDEEKYNELYEEYCERYDEDEKVIVHIDEEFVKQIKNSNVKDDKYIRLCIEYTEDEKFEIVKVLDI